MVTWDGPSDQKVKRGVSTCEQFPKKVMHYLGAICSFGSDFGSFVQQTWAVYESYVLWNCGFFI